MNWECGMSPGRILYIDAMRGFVMLLVVYHHVLLHCPRIGMFSFDEIFFAIMLPLFFFTSGFVLSNESKTWTLQFSWQFMKKKFRALFVPTLIFLLLSDLIFQNSICDSFFSFVKNGYWFTITLFEYFLLFVLIECLIYRLKLKEREDIILLLFTLLVVFIPFVSYIVPSLNLNEHKLYNLLGVKQFYFFIYFIFGVLAKKYFHGFERYALNEKAFAGYIIVFICVLVYSYLYNDGFVITIIAKLLVAFLGILIVFSVFRRYSSMFNVDTVVGKSLIYIGRRTLDIYLLHYFFLPHGIVELLLNKLSDPTSEFIVVAFCAMVTVLICLGISSVIRVSPSLAHLLFGVKKQNSL